MEPIAVEFEVGATPDHAFTTWTEKCALWWPRSHCMSQAEGFDVVFEPFVGGRIYEKAPDGTEFEWGRVTVWDRPLRLEYLWHIFLEPEKATTVEVTFTESHGGTIVRLASRGAEGTCRLGVGGYHRPLSGGRLIWRVAQEELIQ